MPSYDKTADDHWNELDDTHKGHLKALVDHYNTRMHPDHKAALDRHARNSDHASMAADLQAHARSLGLQVTAPALIGIAAWFIKKL
jgi:hypothetical protein